MTQLRQALAAKAKKIQEENEKFARKFSSPHTSQYTVSIINLKILSAAIRFRASGKIFPNPAFEKFR